MAPRKFHPKRVDGPSRAEPTKIDQQAVATLGELVTSDTDGASRLRLHVTLDESGLRYTPDKPPVEIRLTKKQLRSLAPEPPVMVRAATAEEAYREARKLHDEKQPQAPLMRAVESRIAAIQQQQIAELQLKLFPDWPDDRRGAPNTVIRSAIFGVIRRGRRQRVSDLPVAAPNGWSITMTGWRLDQHDLDLWLEVHHLARNAKPGEEVRFTLHSMLRRIGRTGKLGGDNYAWLEERLKALYQTTLLVDSGRHVGGAGNLIRNFRVDRETGEAIIETNPTLRTLWESITHLQVEQRRALGSNQLAKALHAVLASHAEWMPMRVGTLMRRVGADYANLRFFKRDLKAVLDDFVARGWLRSYRFTVGTEGELLEIDKVPSPSQMRAIERRKDDQSRG